MFKKTIEYTDFNGDKQSRDFYFHLTKAEIGAFAHGKDALKERFDKIVNSKDGFAILDQFRWFIKIGCGKRSEDGQRFIKTEEAQSELLDSPAFDVLLEELSTSANGALEFIGKLFPQEVMDKMQEQIKSGAVEDPFKNVPNPASVVELETEMPAYQREHRRPTKAELQKMSREEMQEAFAWSEQNLHAQVQE